jgi:hypothetical protein
MNVYQMRGIAFIPDKVEPDIDTESDAKTYTGANCLNVIFKQRICSPYLDRLMILTSRLAYIYYIVEDTMFVPLSRTVRLRRFFSVFVKLFPPQCGYPR